MTCIVGLESKGVVYMGGDAASVGGYDITTVSHPKVFVNHDLLFGFTSSFRMGQILQWVFQPPRHKKSRTDMEYLVKDFVNSIRKCYKTTGYLQKETSGEDRGGKFLLGYRGHLYTIDIDFQVSHKTHGYDAVGCGDNLAMGALYATENVKDPMKRLQIALEAAAQYSAGVRPPFTIVQFPEAQRAVRNKSR